MTELLDLCYDVLIRILEEIDPGDLAACAQTSWAFNNFIKNNAALYRTHYLRNYDDPRWNVSNAEPEWISELQKFVKCQKILLSGNLDVKRENFNFVNTTVASLISTASESDTPSLNITTLGTLLDIPGNIDAFLLKSTLYTRLQDSYAKPSATSLTDSERQLSAKIHCLHGIPSSTMGRRALNKHPYARSQVYDLRNYTDENVWGPYLSDGSMRVDWEMLEAIMVVLGYNSSLCCRRFLEQFRPPWSGTFEGVVRDERVRENLPEWRAEMLEQVDVPLSQRDPYGVEGVWSRIVCFLDFNDLYQFNFSSNASLVRSNEPREPLNDEEAIRHILMRLRITKIEASTEDCDDQSMPIVHFKGSSRAVDARWDPNANSKIKGDVRMTKEGEVRWTTVSVFYGEERWRSEGIQIGGIGARRGVLGTWFDKDFDSHGPAGPTAFWKLSGATVPDEDDSDDDS
ncbi:hypothetical protein CC80DRAFT_451327 [Byssothecium circinans]|uniref:F-box domain-containing protein n=1 Tax=Byssothecium circinans TaxID=147558 RepID=A0A6A5TNG8_9PLEO|nr:hypothetical protein CC80DRAFT_451327 [Byssothecium circinans]